MVLGISREGDMLDLAVNHEVVNKSGSWFSYGDERLGQGRENVKNYYQRKYVKHFERIEHEVKVKLGLIKEEPEPEKKKAKAEKAESAEEE